MTETNTPQAGQWWEHFRGLRLLAVSRDKLGVLWALFAMDKPPVQVLDQWEGWKHLPDCTGFDWVPEKAEWSDMAAIVALESQLDDFDISSDLIRRVIAIAKRAIWPPEKPICVMCSVNPVVAGTAGCEVCNEYALAATGCPVESLDDWIEITDSHPGHSRRLCDEVCGKTECRDDWYSVTNRTAGMSQRAFPESRIRCRRKDLPPIPEQAEQATKRVPVRFWIKRESFERGLGAIVFAQNRDAGEDMIEIHSDGNGGWFVEVTK